MGNPNNEYYKLSWRERLGFCSGDLAQNLIYQTVSIWLLFYYNNVYGLDSATVAVMFLVVRAGCCSITITYMGWTRPRWP